MKRERVHSVVSAIYRAEHMATLPPQRKRLHFGHNALDGLIAPPPGGYRGVRGYIASCGKKERDGHLAFSHLQHRDWIDQVCQECHEASDLEYLRQWTEAANNWPEPIWTSWSWDKVKSV